MDARFTLYCKKKGTDLISLPQHNQAAKSADRDRDAPHRAPLPHHTAYGSVLRGSADQAESDPGEQRPK